MTVPAETPMESESPGLLLRLIRDQRIAFLLVGATNTVVGFGLFVALDLTLGRWVDAHAGAVWGSLAVLGSSHVLAVLFAFVLYRRFVFRVRGHVWRDLARFESIYLTALGINILTLPLLVQLGANRIAAQAIITLVLTLLSYFGHRHFSFRRAPTD